MEIQSVYYIEMIVEISALSCRSTNKPAGFRDLLDELEPAGEVHPEVSFAHLFPHDGRVHRTQSPPVYDPSLVRESSSDNKQLVLA